MGQVIAGLLFIALWVWMVFGDNQPAIPSLFAALIATIILMVPIILFVAVCWRLVEGVIEAIGEGKPPSPPSPTP